MEFQDLTNQLASDGALSLKILIEQNRFELTPVYYEQQQNGDYTWMGKIENGVGYVVLTEIEGRLAGFVQTQESFWEIVPIEDEVSIIREIDISKFQNETCGLDHILQQYTPEEMQEMMAELCDEDGGCGGIVDVLVLVPTDVQDWYGTQNVWQAFFHQINSFLSFQLALINSGVADISLRFRTVPFNFTYSSPLNIDNDVYETLPDSSAAIRENLRGDIVVMLTSMDYPDVRGGSTIGEIVDGKFKWLAPCEDCAYVISEVQNNVNPTWTLAHEIAHLFGARHNRNSNVPCSNCGDNENICTHGWRFTFGGQDRTIMALLFDDTIAAGAQRALHFSNPDIQFGGFDTGTNNNNNSLGISNANCQVQYYEPSPLFGVTISGLSTPLCLFGGFVIPRTYTANINQAAPGLPGVPPYTYQWRWNEDGNFNLNPGTLIGTNSSITINTVYACPQFFLRLTVTSSDNVTVSATRVINTILCTLCDGPNLMLGNHTNEALPIAETDVLLRVVEGKSKAGSRYELSPNPTSDKLLVERLTSSESNFSVKILDLSGQMLFETDNHGLNKLEIDLDAFPTAMIWVSIHDEYGVSVQKVVKIQD